MTPPELHGEEMEARLARVIVPPDMPISKAIDVLDRGGMGVLIVADAERKLLGVMTDGDFRRAILRSVPGTDPCIAIATRAPVIAPPNVTAPEALDLMDHSRKFLINQLTLVDEMGRVAGLILRSDLMTSTDPEIHAIVMAGGFGLRLRPITTDTPKPMLSIGDRPVMEHMLNHLRNSGIHRVNVTTHYRPEKIVDYFGDGKDFGLDIKYVPEERPLGTAGALGLLQRPEEPLLVINGDILTRVDFGALIAYHREHAADMTVAVRRYDVHVPYGVIECEGAYVKGISEKPTLNFFVNAGIYLLEPSVHAHIPVGRPFDMTELIEALLAAGKPVATFPVHEYWLDIGQHADYERAQQDFDLLEQRRSEAASTGP